MPQQDSLLYEESIGVPPSQSTDVEGLVVLDS